MMADIWMCFGKDCDKKEKCYRHTAPKGIYQYWSSPVIEDGVCINFWDNKEYKTEK